MLRYSSHSGEGVGLVEASASAISGEAVFFRDNQNQRRTFDRYC